MVAVRIPKEIEERLNRLAKRTGRTKTYYVREAILEHLDELEDIYLAEQVLVDVKSGKEPMIGIDELIDKYGLED